MLRLTALLLVLLLPRLAAAQGTSLDVNGTIITIPLPDGYSVRVFDEAPEFMSYLQTSEVEPWEENGEFYEEILLAGFSYGATDPAVIAARFEALFEAYVGSAEAERDGTVYTVDETMVNPGLLEFLLTETSARRPGTMTISNDEAVENAVLFTTSFEMIGVFTYPFVEEVSFVLVNDNLVVAIAQRINLEAPVTKELLATGAELRAGLLAAN